MRLFQLASLVAYATFAIALTITTPQNGDKVDFSKPYEVKWTTVASDPDTFTLILFSSASPNNQKVVTKEAKSSDGSYTIDKLWDIKIGNGYQFNIISNSTHNTGILAQSQTFNVTKVADKPVTTTSATHSATQTVAAPTGSTAGSAALTIPAAGSLVLSLFALVL